MSEFSLIELPGTQVRVQSFTQEEKEEEATASSSFLLPLSLSLPFSRPSHGELRLLMVIYVLA